MYDFDIFFRKKIELRDFRLTVCFVGLIATEKLLGCCKCVGFNPVFCNSASQVPACFIGLVIFFLCRFKGKKKELFFLRNCNFPGKVELFDFRLSLFPLLSRQIGNFPSAVSVSHRRCKSFGFNRNL